MNAAALRAPLLELAQTRSPAARDRLLLGVVDLCEADGGVGSQSARPEIQTLINDIFMGLIGQVERDIRRKLSERLADAPWAPHQLITTLANDAVDIAAPIIARSPVLTDHDLMRILVEATLEHHIEVARRPRLSAELVSAILAQGEPDVMTALAGNATAQLSPLSMERLVAFSQTLVGLRAPLSRHGALTVELGGMLYAWVGETLRADLTSRFEVDGDAFALAVHQAVRDARGAPGDGESLETDERAAMDRRVVEKLRAADQLRPGLLLRALRDGKLTLFTIALASLGDFTTDQIRTALNSDTSEALTLACAAVGVDRGALPTLLALVRQVNDGRPDGFHDAASLKRATATFDREAAARAFQAMIPPV